MIGSYVGAALIVAGFAWLLLRLHLPEQALRINALVRASAATMSDKSLTDRQKERAMRQNSGTLFGQFLRITLGLLAALGLPMALVWLIGFTGLWSFEGAIEASLSWPFLLAGLVLFIAVMMVGRRRRDAG